MPRRSSGPKLWFDKAANPGPSSTADPAIAQGSAQRTLNRLKEHFGTTSTGKHKPAEGPNPLLADVLAAYAEEHIKHVVSGKHILYDIGHLNKWWGTKKVTDISAASAGRTLPTGMLGFGPTGAGFLNAAISALEGQPRADDGDAKDQAAAEAAAPAGLHDAQQRPPGFLWQRGERRT
jgi:hypothetical protein